MRVSTLLPVLMLAAFAAAAQDPAPAPVVQESPLPEKIQQPPSAESAPTVNIRQLDNGDTVEEYRLNGQLYEVRVRPQVGPAYMLLDTNGDGRLDRKDSDGPVAPVYWTLYEWN